MKKSLFSLWLDKVSLPKVFHTPLKLGLLSLALLQSQAALGKATFTSFNNLVKATNEEAWILEYKGTLSTRPKTTYDQKKNELVITLVNDQLDATAFKYPFNISNSVIKRIEYKKETDKKTKKVTTKIILSLKNKIAYKQITDSKAYRFIFTYDQELTNIAPLRVTIDAGHGGRDPGTIGRIYGLKEKNVTWDIAQRLYKMLKSDPDFVPSYTRNGDKYIPVQDRSNIAFKNKANVLISIHADAAANPKAIGASVYAIVNRRAERESNKLLKDRKSLSTLLGGGAQVLQKAPEVKNDLPSLQYANQQKLSTALATEVLDQFGKIANLHRSTPQYQSFGVLRRADIPSILIETGFLSNKYEESKLRTVRYRENIAKAIYDGLVNYRINNLHVYTVKNVGLDIVMVADKTPPKTTLKRGLKATSNQGTAIVGVKEYKVVSGDSLWSIAKKFDVSVPQLKEVNNLTSNNIYVGKIIKIPEVQETQLPEIAQSVEYHKTVSYTVKKGDYLGSIASDHGVQISDIIKVNKNLDANLIKVGQVIFIPSVNKVSDKDENYVTETRLVDSGRTYKVKPGDNLTNIASEYDTDLEDLAEFNKVNKNRILVGMVLKIPQTVTVKVKRDTSSEPISTDDPATNSNKTSSSSTSKKASGATQTETSKEAGKAPATNPITNKPKSTTESSKTATTSNNTTSSKAATSSSSTKATTNSSNAKTPNTTTAAEEKIVTYVVQKRDTLTSIARAHGMTVSELMKLNNLKKEFIFSGQKLKVKAKK